MVPESTYAPRLIKQGIRTTSSAIWEEYLTTAPGTDLKLLFVHSSSTHPDVFKFTLSNQVYCPLLEFDIPLENMELSFTLNDISIAFFIHS